MKAKISQKICIYLLSTTMLASARHRRESQNHSMPINMMNIQTNPLINTNQTTNAIPNDTSLQTIHTQLSSQITVTSQEIKKTTQKIEAILAAIPTIQTPLPQELQKEDRPLHEYKKEELIILINYLNSITKELLALQLQNKIAKKNLDKELSDLLKNSKISKKVALYESNKLCSNLIDIIVSHNKKGAFNEDDE